MKVVYRPEIDGLRAIAVFVVIFYHAEIILFNHNFFKGGYIGVDVFFVISGYLITSFILRELEITNKFSFSNFYERRARRILPALFTVMLMSLPIGWIYLLPMSFTDFTKSILSSVFFGSNFYFHYTGQIYNIESSLLKPFLHTWSLSIEEQFYIIYPLILILCLKFLKKYIYIIFLIGILISLLFADWGSKNYPSFTFYSLSTRGWELLAGAILAKIELSHGRQNYKIFNQTLTALGLFLIILSVIFFDNETFHPSLYTLPPIIGTMLIIWFSGINDMVTKILSSKPFVGLGLISYSLYLWHYPIFSFARIKHPSISDYDKLEIFALIFVLSILSYYLIEKPFRNKKIISKKILMAALSIIILFLLSFHFFAMKTNGFEDRLHVFLKRELKKNPWEILKDENGLCLDRKNNFCSFNKSGRKKIFLVGDSRMESISGKLLEKLKSQDINFISINRTGCPYLPDFDRIDHKTNKIIDRCNQKTQNTIKNELLSNKNSIIILGGFYKSYLTKTGNESFISKSGNISISSGFINSVQELLDNNLKIIIIYPIPTVNFHVSQRLMNLIPKKSFNASEYLKNNPQTISLKNYLDQNKEIFDLLDKLNHKNILKVFPHKLFCDTKIPNRCLTHDDKNVYYFDTLHLASKGSEILVNKIYLYINKLFPK